MQVLLKTVSGIQSNFHILYTDINCPLCGLEVDSFEHCLSSVVLIYILCVTEHCSVNIENDSLVLVNWLQDELQIVQPSVANWHQAGLQQVAKSSRGQII